MDEKHSYDWDHRTESVLDDQIAGYDEMRQRCPVARSRYQHWSLFRHEDVMRVLDDPQTFSSAVSSYLSIPNGLDAPLHTEYRRLIDPYFNPQRMAAFEPVCRSIAVSLVDSLPMASEVELMTALAQDFALQIQSAFLGWPVNLHEPLRQWTRKNQRAILARDKDAMGYVALEFDGYIKDLLTVRRQAGADAPDDITTSLLRERINGRLLSDEEIVSILRNWTVGELGTIAASVGILAQYLAQRPDLQRQLRGQTSLLPTAIDEILRIHAPLINARRVATQPVEIGGRPLAQSERVHLIWASADRDETVFGDPDEFRLDRNPAKNLLYGAGVHVCPGAPLARMELRIVMEELLGRTREIALVAEKEPVKALYPGSGFSVLPLRVVRGMVNPINFQRTHLGHR